MLLTIAIPTYNRATYLELCIDLLGQQIINSHYLSSCIDILITDNRSSDNTIDVILEAIEKYPNVNIRYVQNDTNLGLDGNITKCFQLAEGDFVLIFGDDDILIPGSLNKIVKIIKSNRECGNIYINRYGFTDSYLKGMPKTISDRYYVYKTVLPYFAEVHYNFSFTSGNVFNKSIIKDEIDSERFLGTNLNLYNWIFNAALKCPYNIIISDKLIGMKTSNTGGYGFCETFGINGNIIFEYFKKLGYSQSLFDVINNNMLVSMFPHLIRKYRISSGKFFKEDYFKILNEVYRDNFRFWLFCYPAIKLVPPLEYFSYSFNKCYQILNALTRKVYLEYHLIKGDVEIKNID